MNVILFGATGMVGSGVLTECLEDPRVRSVLVVGRSPSGVAHRLEDAMAQYETVIYDVTDRVG